MFRRLIEMLKCEHRFIPQYQLYAKEGREEDLLYVSKCNQCTRHQYKSRARILKDGAKK